MKKRLISSILAVLVVVVGLVAVNQSANAAAGPIRLGDFINGSTGEYKVTRVRDDGRQALAGTYCFGTAAEVTIGPVWRVKRTGQRVYRCGFKDAGKGW